MNHPSRENVYMLRNDEGKPTALIMNRQMFSLELLGDEEMAELFNGGNCLPIVPAQLGRNEEDESDV